MGILPESTDSLKTSYFSRESTFRVASDIFVAVGVRYAFKHPSSRLRRTGEGDFWAGFETLFACLQKIS